MYNAIHKLKGVCVYAGIMRVGAIAEKMQKLVQSSVTDPNIERYKNYLELLLREMRLAYENFEILKA
jgi:HPt (histidine-containing phosphotransfer) domain-containing protein